MPRRTLSFATFLAPSMLPVYQFITRYLGRKLGVKIELFEGTSYAQMETQADGGFLCGLAYVEMTEQGRAPVEPLAAPVLHGDRYGDRPIYYSDLIVRRDSPFYSFADLRGRTWCYNEPQSHSGYGIMRYRLARLGERCNYFGRIIETGYHHRSIRLVCTATADIAAIDSQVLAVALRDQPELRSQLRVIDSFGPSTIQPFVASRCLPAPTRARLRSALLELGKDPKDRASLARGLIKRFIRVDDASYDDIRRMADAAASVDSAGNSALKTLGRSQEPGTRAARHACS